MTEFTRLPDLAARRFGGSVMQASDEFFAAKENLIRDEPPAFTPRTYGPRGQIYDGWETRRRRDVGPDDHALIRLGMPGTVRGIIVDTAHFTGNYPPEVSVDGCAAPGYPAADELLEWFPLVPRTGVDGDRPNAFEVTAPQRVTHLRLSLHPDGGVARLRVHGEPMADPALLRSGAILDLAALENGGIVVEASDEFYGSPQNILAPGIPRSTGEGWETRRRREGGNDWVVVRLGVPGVVRLVEIDTTCFIGNAPSSAALTGAANGEVWSELLPLTRLQPDTRHRFAIAPGPVVSRVRLDILPDGGLGRLRLWGSPASR